MFTETIGMTLAEIVDFLLAHGYSVTVIPETEDECGCVTTRTSEYAKALTSLLWAELLMNTNL